MMDRILISKESILYIDYILSFLNFDDG